MRLSHDRRPSVVGLIPAAGSAARLGRLPCSKELLPLDPGDATSRRPPTVAIGRLVEAMAAAGVERVVIAIRDGKWDIPAYLADGRDFGVPISYVVLASTGSILETLRGAVPWLGDELVVLAFPDILFEPAELLTTAVEALRSGSADVTLAAVPTDRPGKADILDFGADGLVRAIHIKPPPPWPSPAWTWIGAAWRPAMTQLLLEPFPPTPGREPYPGDLLRTAIARGLEVRAVAASGGRHLDIGTPDDLARAWREALL